MTWKTLAEALESALALQMEKGTGAVEGPGQVFMRYNSETTQPATEAATSLGNAKGRPVHSPAPPQRRTGRPLPLRVIEGGLGGGRRKEEGTSAAFRYTAGRGRRSKLILVVG